MKPYALILLLPLFIGLSGCDHDQESIPIVGYDNFGILIYGQLPFSTYTENLQQGLIDVNETAEQAFSSYTWPSDLPWDLNAFSIGVGINAEAYIHFITKLGVGARLRLLFVNQKQGEHND